jgi:hypothetical protein
VGEKEIEARRKRKKMKGKKVTKQLTICIKTMEWLNKEDRTKREQSVSNVREVECR